MLQAEGTGSIGKHSPDLSRADKQAIDISMHHCMGRAMMACM